MNSAGRPPLRRPVGAKLTDWFTLSAGVILTITGAAKLVSVFGVARVLTARAPLVGINVKTLLIGAGVTELVVAAACFHPKTRSRSPGWVAALATLFLLYRLALWLTGWQGPCGCLGNLTGALGLAAETSERIVEFLLAYLLVGSYAALICKTRA